MIKSLTSLRGIFILFIFFHHCENIYPGGGSMAVAFFFVLSGFSMTLGYRERVLQPQFSYRQYITRRCLKFYPLHWLCLLATIPLVILTIRLNQITVFFLNAALLQTWIPIEHVYFSFNAVSWYLADTMFFALVFPFVFRVIARATLRGKVGLAVFIMALYVSVAIMIPREQYHAILYISPCMRLTDFVFGIYLALGYLNLKEKQKEIWHLKNGTLSLLVIIALIAMLVVESYLLGKGIRLIAPYYWPLVALLILTASLSETVWGGHFLECKWLQRLGELSFTIFLVHQLVIRYLNLILKHVQIDNVVIFATTSFILTIMVSIVVERHILKPITQWLTKRIQPSMTVRS